MHHVNDQICRYIAQGGGLGGLGLVRQRTASSRSGVKNLETRADGYQKEIYGDYRPQSLGVLFL